MNYSFPQIYPVACHTDNVGKGSIYVALPGTKVHGVQFILDAVTKGAISVVAPTDTEIAKDVLATLKERGIALERTDRIRERFAQLAAHANGNPSKKLHCIGVTGTKGKTTTSFIIRSLLHDAGYKTALLGTVHNQINEYILPQSLTTPHADYLQVFLAECVRQGVTHVVLEVSAQALTLARVFGIQFAGIIFTNFSQEHAEFYATQEEYFAAKCKLFKQVAHNAPVVLNADDAWFGKFDKSIQELSIVTVGIDQAADFPVVVQHSSMQDGLTLTVGDYVLNCPALVGTFNAYNIAMAFVLCYKLGIPVHTLQKSLEHFGGVKGRMQSYALPNGAQCIIDHAHTPSSFEAVLSTLRSHTKDLIVLFGIGGNRDTIKRPILGAIASQYADSVILTTDNPRSEEPGNIIEDIKRGISQDTMHKVHVVLDREEAIKFAYSISQKGSIIALLAKGSDEYQEVKGVKYPFVEREIIARL